MVRALARARPKKRALRMTIRAIASARCVNLHRCTDVARRIDPLIGGAQVVIDGHAGRPVVRDTGGFEIEISDGGGAADADNDLVHREFAVTRASSAATGWSASRRGLPARADRKRVGGVAFEVDDLFRAAPCDVGDIAISDQVDAFDARATLPRQAPRRALRGSEFAARLPGSATWRQSGATPAPVRSRWGRRQ